MVAQGCCPYRVGPKVRLAILSVCLLLYVVIGALIISSIELDADKQNILRIRDKLNTFYLKIQTHVTEAEFEALIRDVADTSAQNIPVTIHKNSSMGSWDFGSSMLFSATLLTTIGYGHNPPLTQGGKIFTIMYTLVGLPVTFIFLSACVQRLLIPCKMLLDFLRRRVEYKLGDHFVHLLHLALIYLIVIVLVVLIPAIIFSQLEQRWNYLDAIYYCFVTLTTIGLGDYVPGDSYQASNRSVYKAAVAFYLYIGLMFVMTGLTVMYNIKFLNLAQYFHPIEEETDSEKLQLSKLEETENYNTQAAHQSESHIGSDSS